MSKLESSLDKALAKLGQFKNIVIGRVCALWQQQSPRLKQVEKLDYATTKSFLARFKWRILLILILLYAGSKTYDYFFASGKKAGGPQTVTSIVVEKKDVPLIIEATGTIVSNSIVDIRPMVTNTVTKVHIKDGQEVKEGELLFSLDDRNDKANYEKLKALADDAQKQYLRAKELVAKNFISKAGLETSLANAKSAQAAARAAEVQLSYDSTLPYKWSRRHYQCIPGIFGTGEQYGDKRYKRFINLHHQFDGYHHAIEPYQRSIYCSRERYTSHPGEQKG